MIPDITPLNLPSWAAISSATVSLADMAEKTVTTQISFDGAITPDFSKDWEIVYRGEKYIMPLRTPSGVKENTTLSASVDLTFHHWAVWQLKRWMFFTVQPVESGTAVPDKYIASVSLNLADFCNLFGQVLNYYYGEAITIDLNPDWAYDPSPAVIEISRTHLWDLLIKFYELFAVRWTIGPAPGNSNTAPGGERYVIRVGYPAAEISHILQYGFEGGLLRIERQAQNEEIRNMLLGRGGEKNLPYRYFKDVDPDNPSFPADPDWIPELRNIYFSELHGKTFRDYIRGWKTNPARMLTEPDGTPIKPYGSNVPISLAPYDPDYAAANFAYLLGHTDTRFNPVEYVKDDASIRRYGPLQDVLENNDDIYPTIQRVTVAGLGRIDQTVDIQPITSDDIDQGVESAVEPSNVEKASGTARKVPKNGGTAEILITGASFIVPQDKAANFDPVEITLTATVEKKQIRLVAKPKEGSSWYDTNPQLTVTVETTSTQFTQTELLSIEEISGDVIDTLTGQTHTWSGIGPGTWRYRIKVKVKNSYTKKALDITASCESPVVISATPVPEWTDTWDIWVKNLWGSVRLPGESDTAYAERIWGPILGDRTGSEAKIVFSDGWLSTSQDYEFVITRIPIPDTTRTIDEKDADGNVIATYPSHWRITLGKCDADLDTTGLYLPSTRRQANPGDHFFFIGIDMPRQYVLWAEEALDGYKTDQLGLVSEIKPAFTVTLDRVRINRRDIPDPGSEAFIALEKLGLLRLEDSGRVVIEESGLIRLADQLLPGASVRLADPRFITTETPDGKVVPGSPLTLYIQSATITYREPSSDDAALNPDVEIVLSDSYETAANPVATIQGEVSAISRQLGAISNVEQIVRAVGDRLYLRKDGLPDRSMSPTEYASLLTSLGFRSGIAGGKGWGFFKDDNGYWVLETDRINVRQDMQVNNLVINQITARSGMIVESAAQMEITRVVEHPDSYECFFDQRSGTVANLFRPGDIAWSSRFTPDNAEEKVYRRRVTAVSEQSVTLTKPLDGAARPDSWPDSGVRGDGVPEEGDVIAHYGSYTDPSRRFIKIRDVISGGYERYIENLDSVNSDGTEYYFVGRQTGSYANRPRFYLGDPQGYIEWIDGQLNIRGRLSLESPVGDKTLSDLLDPEIGARNLLLNSRGPFTTVVTTDHPSDTAAYLTQVCTAVPLIQGQTYTVRATADGEWTNDHPGSIASAPDDNVTLWLMNPDDPDGWQLVSTSSTGSEKGSVFTWQHPDATVYIRVNSYGKPKTFREIMLVKGNVITTAYTPAPEDFDYLTEALRQSTTTEGGLVQTSQISLGYTDDNGNRHTQAGTSGLYNGAARGGGIAIWAGGDQIDAQDDPARGAAFAVRMDGSAYAARNTVRFRQNLVEVGDYVTLDADGLKLFGDKEHTEERLIIANTTVGSESDIIVTDSIPVNETRGLTMQVAGQQAGTIITRAAGSGVSSSKGSATVTGGESVDIPIGTLTKGSVIQLDVTCAFTWHFSQTVDGLIDGRAGGNLVVELRRTDTTDPILVYSPPFEISSLTACMAAIRINANATAGTYLLRVYPAFNPDADFTPTPTTLTATLTVRGSAKIGMPKSTRLCTDGLVSVWENTVLMVKDNLALMRVGAYGLKITSTGITVIRDGTESPL